MVETISLLTDALAEARERTLALVAPLSDADVETQHDAIMSPLAWDLAHIAAYEDLWLGHRLGGQPLLRPEVAAMYDGFEAPRGGGYEHAAGAAGRGARPPADPRWRRRAGVSRRGARAGARAARRARSRA